jgi:preprotein translocase subunit SecG
MYALIMTIHVITCVLVVLIVLIQAGRSGGFSGLMGGGGGDAIFSTSSQQSGLRKATVALAAIFMATSLFLTILSSRRTGQSVFQQQFPALPPVSAPQVPTAPTGAVPAPNGNVQTIPSAPAPAEGKK